MIAPGHNDLAGSRCKKASCSWCYNGTIKGCSIMLESNRDRKFIPR